MKGFGTKLIHAAAIAGLLSGLVATPAFADHDRDKHWKKHGRHHRYDRDWDSRRTYYYRDYDRGYYYAPRSYYYGPPGVYVHPAPPSFGLSLVFPIR